MAAVPATRNAIPGCRSRGILHVPAPGIRIKGLQIPQVAATLLERDVPTIRLGSVPDYYHAPGGFTRYFLNPQVALLNKLGISMNGARTLAVKGRKSGQWRTTPVNLLVHDGHRYLVAPHGETQWVRNLRVAGTGELRLGRRAEGFRIRELGNDEKVNVLRAYLKKWRQTAMFFDGTGPGASDDKIRAVATQRPVFEVLPDSTAPEP